MNQDKISVPKIYPKDDEIKVKVRMIHIALIALSILIWPIFFYINPLPIKILQKLLSLLGLHLDIIGVIVASLKTPYYGSFCDGGKLEEKRANREDRYFIFGMILMGVGFLLQALATAL